MWAKQSSDLKPLIQLWSYKAKFKWIPAEQLAFDNIKYIVMEEMILA